MDLQHVAALAPSPCWFDAFLSTTSFLMVIRIYGLHLHECGLVRTLGRACGTGRCFQAPLKQEK